MNTYDRHNRTTTLKLILSACLLLVLSACSKNDDTAATTETEADIPQFIVKAALNTTDGHLLAWITIDGGTRSAMTIDSAAGTVSTSIPGLSRTTHTVLIEFEFTDNIDTITLATVTSSVDLSGGNATLTFTDSDYTTSFDTDNDGISNLNEIINGTSPVDCVLDTSVIGSCTLG